MEKMDDKKNEYENEEMYRIVYLHSSSRGYSKIVPGAAVDEAVKKIKKSKYSVAYIIRV